MPACQRRRIDLRVDEQGIDPPLPEDALRLVREVERRR